LFFCLGALRLWLYSVSSHCMRDRKLRSGIGSSFCFCPYTSFSPLLLLLLLHSCIDTSSSLLVLLLLSTLLIFAFLHFLHSVLLMSIMDFFYTLVCTLWCFCAALPLLFFLSTFYSSLARRRVIKIAFSGETPCSWGSRKLYDAAGHERKLFT
jgi:hypothetical protein